MAKGTAIKGTWDFWVGQLQAMRCRFRMFKKKGRPFIFIREYTDDRPREFSSQVYQADLDEHIEACAKECIEASKRGKWRTLKKNKVEIDFTWAELASNAEQNLCARVARVGSRKNALGHLKEIATFTGEVTVKKLRAWALERDPITQPSAFRNRLETLSHIDKAGDLDLKQAIIDLKAKRPTGAAKKEQERRTQSIKAIPSDEQLQAWLDQLEGHEQWVLALIATYGLRPSEAWHAERIDADGWIVIPGDGLTKTERHIAPPQPADWLERYQLKENFKKYQAEVNERWPIVWEDRAGLRIPTNNSVVTNALYHRLYGDRIARLWVGKEWVRPYDLRHSYAIRCETSQDPILLATSSEEFAKWLGHTLDIHKRVYLRFMTAERKDASTKARIGTQKESPALAELPDDIKAKLEKLAALEKLMAG